ncbi:MAG: hypothetical protein QOJ15_9137 [Bradyrhizobium sp.]|jgi:hypothetical protein|nr:hypothetical protein [Bradyrhizobium sp.]
MGDEGPQVDAVNIAVCLISKAAMDHAVVLLPE